MKKKKLRNEEAIHKEDEIIEETEVEAGDNGENSEEEVIHNDDKNEHKSFAYLEVKAVDGEQKVKVILTKQVEDRDGEIVSVQGCDLTNYKKNPIVLWGHRMIGADVQDIIGRAVNIKKEVGEDGVPMITAEVEFADHPQAQYLKQMILKKIITTVSIGFLIKKYDPQTRTIVESELLEFSFVPVPANTEAVVTDKTIKEANDKLAKDLFVKLANYEKIHPKIKAYRKLFLGDEILEKIGYNKSGSEIADIKEVYARIMDILKQKEEDADSGNNEEPENPENQEDQDQGAETQPATKKDLLEIIGVKDSEK